LSRRQGRHHPPRTPHRPRHRPGYRRAHRRAAVPVWRRQAAGPARRHLDRPPRHPPRRDRQEGQPPHPAPRVHHRRAGRRGAAPRRAGGRLPCRPAHHHALRPCPHQPGPARRLHRRRLRRRSGQVNPTAPLCAAWPPGDGQAASTSPMRSRLVNNGMSANRRYGRLGALVLAVPEVAHNWAFGAWCLQGGGAGQGLPSVPFNPGRHARTGELGVRAGRPWRRGDSLMTGQAAICALGDGDRALVPLARTIPGQGAVWPGIALSMRLVRTCRRRCRPG
jgi:hypothetical protein